MVTSADNPQDWAVLPGAALVIELTTKSWTSKPVIEIHGNRQGLVSLGTLLIWISDDPAATESLSITGLSFIQFRSRLSLTVVQNSVSDTERNLIVRTDKSEQYQWLTTDEELGKVAMEIVRVGCTSDEYAPHMHIRDNPASDVEMFIHPDEGLRDRGVLGFQ